MRMSRQRLPAACDCQWLQLAMAATVNGRDWQWPRGPDPQTNKVATALRQGKTGLMTHDTLLGSRQGLPAELLALLDEHPRAGWPAHPGFHGLVSFWLERHLGFRQLTARIAAETEALIAGHTDPATFPQRLVPLGRRLVDELIGHHQIEDDAYFPELAALEPRLSRGFDILDADHHALDAALDGFVTGANSLLQNVSLRPDLAPALLDAAGRFHASLAPFEQMLHRHLTDEEDLILPVILKHRYG